MKRNNTILIILRPLIWFVSKYVFCAQFHGLENISGDKSLVLAGNHTSILDCLLVIASSKRIPHFLVKSELHKTKIGRWFFKNCGTIPVDRSKKNPDAMKASEEVLNNNNIIVIFPEGTINRTKEVIMPFKFGAVKLSSSTNSPIVPFVIKGKYKVFRKSVSITFFKPMKINKDLEVYNNKLMKIVSRELERK